MKPSSIISWIVVGTFCFIPLFFLPVTQDFYDTNKWMLLVVVAIAVFFLSLARTWKSKHIHLALTPVSLGLLAITTASVVSLFVSSTNKIEALLNPFGPVTFAALASLSLLVPGLIEEKVFARMRFLLYSAASFIALIAIYQFFGMGKIMFPGVKYLADTLWTPTGSTMATVSILIVMLPLLAWEAFEAQRRRNEAPLAFLIIMTVTVITGLGISLWQLFPRISGTLLSIPDGWRILLEMFKTPRHALAGVGAENFLVAFNSSRPPAFNLSPLWMVRFTTSTNTLFHLTTVYGLLGAVASLVFFKSFIAKKQSPPYTISLLLGFLVLLTTPPSLSVLVVLTALLMLTNQRHAKKITLTTAQSLSVGIGITIISVALTFASLYGIIRAYTAELTFYQAIKQAQGNNGTATYNLQTKAIKQNPGLSRFHIFYSQTSLVLATSLARNPDQPEDRDMIAQLIQQAIREAKLATALGPLNIVAWENLARIYGQLIDVAQGADVWTIASYKHAIELDPNNPVLRLELGSIHVRLKNYTEAITQFQKAISLKPNYANAYYNLASVYKISGDRDAALRAMNQAASFVDRNSQDFLTVSRQLEDLKKDPPAPIVAPPLALPEGSGPNVPEPVKL